jgi:ribonuclease HI
MRLSIYADGASRGNPGPGAIGAAIIDEYGRNLAGISQNIGLSTNNQAEYKAAIAAIRKAKELKAKEVTLYLDSELVVNQLNGKYKVKSTLLYPLYMEAAKLMKEFNKFVAIHIPREENKIADALARAALRK